MAYRVVVMPSARADLDEYTAYIAEDSPGRAVEWLSQAWELIFSLKENPKRFAVIPEAHELGGELRDVRHFSHRIVYWVREEQGVVEIIRVYHGARRELRPDDL